MTAHSEVSCCTQCCGDQRPAFPVRQAEDAKTTARDLTPEAQSLSAAGIDMMVHRSARCEEQQRILVPRAISDQLAQFKTRRTNGPPRKPRDITLFEVPHLRSSSLQPCSGRGVFPLIGGVTSMVVCRAARARLWKAARASASATRTQLQVLSSKGGGMVSKPKTSQEICLVFIYRVLIPYPNSSLREVTTVGTLHAIARMRGCEMRDAASTRTPAAHISINAGSPEHRRGVKEGTVSLVF